MHKLFFYPRLAFSNLKNNRSLYIPFTITSMLSAAMFFIIYSLSVSKTLGESFGGGYLSVIMRMAMIVAVLFFTVFLFYTQSFLIKRRKKELGLYSVLGMEKKHILITMFFETLYIAVVSIAGGVALGAVFAKLTYLALLKILNFSVSLEFEFSIDAVTVTAIVFAVIFFMLYLQTVRSIRRQNAVDLLKGASVGEKEPKTKWVSAIIGIISLGLGYYIALTAGNPLEAVPLFVFAVILVMVGTYCLFSAGSIAFLKMLRKNKSYYYKTKHFVSVSGMIYRMKQNAVGLGNICILCTAVLVMISTTVSLYGGMETVLRNRYPRNFTVFSSAADNALREDMNRIVDSVLAERKLAAENVIQTAEYSIPSIQKGDSFSGRPKNSYSASDVTNLHFVKLSDYKRLTGDNATLEKNECILCVVSGEFESDTLRFGDTSLSIKKRIDSYEMASRNLAYMVNTYYVIVPQESTIYNVYKALGGTEKKIVGDYEYSFDSSASDEEQIKLYKAIKKELSDNGLSESCFVESAQEARDGFYQLYGGLLFVGIYLGLIFLMATVLIIYYKQISEGYEDKSRYQIMQKVGMDPTEVKKSIHSQVLTVFFLPLITAFIHMAFAFPIITKLLALLNLTQISVFVTGLIITAVAFSLVYALVYAVTAKAYYRIVSAS